MNLYTSASSIESHRTRIVLNEKDIDTLSIALGSIEKIKNSNSHNSNSERLRKTAGSAS